MVKRTYTPIAVAYRKKSGKRVWVKEFIHERCPDKLITVRGTRLPENCEIVQVGVGKRFFNKFKLKYKANEK